MQAPVSPVLSPGAQPTVGATSLYGVTQLSSSSPALARPYPSIPSGIGASSGSPREQVFPERPGEPECQYYLKTGDCKFGSSCHFDHPRDRVAPRTNCLLSPAGLPLRPVNNFIHQFIIVISNCYLYLVCLFSLIDSTICILTG